MPLKPVKQIGIDDQAGILYAGNKEVILIPAEFIKTLRAIFIDLVGKEGTELINYKIGEGLGRAYVQSLDYVLKKEGANDLGQETRLKIACNAIFMESGWGRVQVCGLDPENDQAEITLFNSPTSRFIEGSRHNLEKGILAGVYEQVTGRRVFYDLINEKVEEKEITLKMTKQDPDEILRQGALTILSRKELEKRIDSATEEVRKEKEKVSSVIDSLFDGLLMIDGENKIILANPRAEKFLNKKQDELIGKSIDNLNIGTINELLREIKEKPQEELTSEEIVIDPLNKGDEDEDNEIYIRVTVKPVISSGQQNIGYMVVLHDITRSKILERLKNEFITISAHQLRTPLAAVKWSLQMVLNGEMGQVNDEVKKYLQKSYVSNERMIALVNQLLNVARIEEGRFVYNLRLVHPIDIINEAINSLSSNAFKQGVSFDFTPPTEKIPNIKVDIEKLRLAIHNVIDNAVRYSPSGGKVTIKIEKVEKKNHPYVQISINDQGIGIADNEKKRIFSKFFRGETAVRLQTEGSGLGLFITKNIIQAHGGKIWLESEKDRGATFFLRLPASTEEV